MDFMGYSDLLLIGLGIFMLLDSFLSILLGDRYMRWGLGYTPAFYRRLMERIYSLPPAAILGLKLSEMAAGAVLLFTGLS
ncbi:hypothetical protein ig2599ANME_2314 [groundwater metagenome]